MQLRKKRANKNTAAMMPKCYTSRYSPSGGTLPQQYASILLVGQYPCMYGPGQRSKIRHKNQHNSLAKNFVTNICSDSEKLNRNNCS